jgi:hypothetical protein
VLAQNSNISLCGLANPPHILALLKADLKPLTFLSRHPWSAALTSTDTQGELLKNMLTIPASISKRKQACIGCRRRKKRCDVRESNALPNLSESDMLQAARPGCSLCKKFGLPCRYTIIEPGASQLSTRTRRNPYVLLPALAPKNHGKEAPHVSASETMDFATANSVSQHPGVSFVEVQTNRSGSNPGYDVADVDDDMSLLQITQLPTREVLRELVDIFFDRFYSSVPCFHKRKLVEEVDNGCLQKEAPLVLYAICCLASSRHLDPNIQQRQNEWYELAKLSYELTTRSPYQGFRAIQAVLLLVYHATTIGDFSASWLFLGKAWRQAVALGLNRLDSSNSVTDEYITEKSFDDCHNNKGKTVVEKEECRRTLWLLFMLDRGHAWPTGSPSAVSELHFKVNIPLPETNFQDLDLRLKRSPFENAVFTPNLKTLIAPSSTSSTELNLFYYLAIAHILLGRVAELVHSLHSSPYTLEYAEQCNELDAFIVKFRLSIPLQATSIFEASSKDRQQVIWLNLVLDTTEILLHYRCSVGVPVSDASSQFAVAVNAARNAAQLIKDASRTSVDYLLSAHFGAPLYMAACVLILQWNTTKDTSMKEDINLFELVFDRMSEVFLLLGMKFKMALERDLTRNEGELRALRAKGAQGLLADCSKWGFVQDEIKRRGFDVQIS